MADVIGRRWMDTELRGRVVVAEENAAAAMEVMSRFAIAPEWLVNLPPTMSPSETSAAEGWLERPEEAFGYFRKQGVAEVVCEEKHIGSRAVIALCRTCDLPEHIVRLRERSVGGKRNFSLREFALGHEAHKRFVAKEPLRQVHECVFEVLALESEPIDPRL